MNAGLIILGVILPLPAAWVLLILLGHLMYWLLATNAIDYLIWPAIIISAIAGVWVGGVGLAWW